MCRFFETIKIQDGIPQNLESHQKRIDKTSMGNYKVQSLFNLAALIYVPELYSKGVSKCKFIYDDKHSSFYFEKYRPLEIKSLKLIFCDDIDYSYKYSDRTRIEDLRKLKADCDDILIVKDGLVTDTSFANIAFFDGYNWITPEAPLLEGTCRNRLIAEGRIIAKKIRWEDIKLYEIFVIFNAMRGEDLFETYPVSNIK
ncbi:MAG: aminotransferase class IV family protein [Bacteroidales bacterium]|nr:aminotransferase class IV family protein [Bacteroidales bacterium]